MTDFSIVLTTTDSRNRAKHLARALVEAKLAACVQIIPITSVYRWDGDVQEAEELLLIAKLREADVAAAQAFIVERHSYEVPEVVALPIVSGSDPYLRWLDAATAR